MAMRKEMKCLQILRPGHAEVMDLPVPKPKREEVLVKVLAVTTCPHWDLHIYQGQPMFVNVPISYPYPPGQPGHEMSGIVASVGPEVTGFKCGDRVSAWRDQGHHRPGCYAQYVIIDERNLIRVPETLDPVSTAALELAMCIGASILDLKTANAISGKRVGVNGLGPAGLVAAQLMRAEGASEVIGFDTEGSRGEYAKSHLRLSHVVDPLSDEGKDLPMRKQPDVLLDTSIDCVGLRESVQYIMDHTKGIVALFGVQREDYTYGLMHTGLKLFGYPGHSIEAARYALQKLSEGSLDLGLLVTHRMKLEDYREAVRLLKTKSAIKVCFLPNKD